MFMNPFEERFTAWVDGELEESEKLSFEAELRTDCARDKQDAIRLGDLLRTCPAPPSFDGGDFFNHQLLERIRALESPASALPRGKKGGLSWFAWAGACSAVAAAVLFHFLIPIGPQETGASSGGYMAQLSGTRPSDPGVTVSAFHSKKDDVSVVWLDGLDYLPETADLK